MSVQHMTPLVDIDHTPKSVQEGRQLDVVFCERLGCRLIFCGNGHSDKAIPPSTGYDNDWATALHLHDEECGC